MGAIKKWQLEEREREILQEWETFKKDHPGYTGSPNDLQEDIANRELLDREWERI